MKFELGLPPGDILGEKPTGRKVMVWGLYGKAIKECWSHEFEKPPES